LLQWYLCRFDRICKQLRIMRLEGELALYDQSRYCIEKLLLVLGRQSSLLLRHMFRSRLRYSPLRSMQWDSMYRSCTCLLFWRVHWSSYRR
jgi:hypothetical protein